MELIKNLKFMCRICAVNIKKRRINSNAVSIINSPQLCEKLNKYLNLNINFNDDLPKSICAVCYKKVESIHALAALAKKTENFLNDFIKIAQTNLQEAQSTSLQSHFQNEFNSFALSDQNEDLMIDEEDVATSEPEEVVLNFTLNDPLTKKIKQQQQQQQQQRNSSVNQDINIAQQLRSNMSNATDLLREIHKKEIASSLDQKRQNLKMVLNNTGSCNQQTQHRNNNETTNNYKVNIIPSTSNSALNQHSINVAVQIQQQPPVYNQHQQIQQKQFESSLLTSDNNNRQQSLMNDCLNLGSVIKDMDLLKLILKALKWPFNAETLMSQIHRLKSTRFRDVMVDPNLLQDTDMMQILSSYLSPILLQTSMMAAAISQTAPISQTLPPPPQMQPIPIQHQIPANILPPSVSYKIPAETSVRLVSVPREEERQESRHLYEEQILPPPPPIRRNKKHKSKSARMNDYNRMPVIVVSDESSEEKFEVNVDPTLYFNNPDSSHENSCESASWGYFKQKQFESISNSQQQQQAQRQQQQQQLQQQQQQQQQQQLIQQHQHQQQQQRRKKQKRKQSLNKLQINRNFDEHEEIVIVDENGEKPIRLSGNEITVIPKNILSKHIEPIVRKQNIIEIIAPAKKKIKHISRDLSFANKISSLTKQLNVPSVIKSFSEEKNLPQQQRQEPCVQRKELNADVVLLPATKQEEKQKQTNEVKSIEYEPEVCIQKIPKNEENTPSEEPTIESHEIDDTESNTDTNDKLIIDEDHIDDEKVFDEPDEEDVDHRNNKNEDEIVIEEIEKDEVQENKNNPEKEVELPKEATKISESNIKEEIVDESNLRRSQRQVKVKGSFKRNNRNVQKLSITTKKVVTVPETPANPTSSSAKKLATTRLKTRKQLQEEKVQTRKTNVTQRGREIKPSLKYSPSKKRS